MSDEVVHVVRLQFVKREGPPARIFVRESGPIGSDRHFYFTGEQSFGLHLTRGGLEVFRYEQGHRYCWADVNGNVVKDVEFEEMWR